MHRISQSSLFLCVPSSRWLRGSARTIVRPGTALVQSSYPNIRSGQVREKEKAPIVPFKIGYIGGQHPRGHWHTSKSCSCIDC